MSVFDSACPYPVWHRDVWLKEASPPEATFDYGAPFFEQLWSLFQSCPIPHNVGAGNENCEFTDDWWYSRNCYLCHSGLENEDCAYCYRIYKTKNCQFVAFGIGCELSVDLVNCQSCTRVQYGINCSECHDSALLFDCRNCSDCLFCWNLRHKRYCFENQQLTRAEFERVRASFDLSSRQRYETEVERFQEAILKNALWKATNNHKCEDVSGAYQTECHRCENCYFINRSDDCVNYVRGIDVKTALDCVCVFTSERVYMSSMVQDRCYDIRYCINVMRSRELEYCAHCFDCKNCFACCGLVGRQYCIMNRQFSAADYQCEVEKLRSKVKTDGLEDCFFPGYFAASPYEESLAAVHFPLDEREILAHGFRGGCADDTYSGGFEGREQIPDRAVEADLTICSSQFWDAAQKRPFRITQHDLQFAQLNTYPLNSEFYLGRMKRLFSWMFFDGAQRDTVCARSGAILKTNLPVELEGRVVADLDE